MSVASETIEPKLVTESSRRWLAQQVSYQTKRANRRLSAFPRLVPFFWVSGLDFLAPVIFSFWALITRSFPRVTRVPKFAALGFFLCLALLLSVAISGVTEISRASSSLYSVAILLFCSLLYVAYYQRVCVEKNVEFFVFVVNSLSRLFVYCVIFILVVVSVAYLTRSFKQELPSLLGQVAPSLPGIADRSTRLVFTQPDWGLGFPAPRTFIFSPWYTAGAMTLYLSGIFALMGRVLKRRSVNSELLIEFAIFVCIVTTLTRTVVAIYIVSFFISSIIFRDKVRLCIFYTFVFLMLLIIISSNLFSNFSEFRGYSTASRFEAYFLGIVETLKGNFLTGIGFKPTIEDLLIPVGSHSSWISLFVRGGAIGVGLFAVMFYLYPMQRWTRALGAMRSDIEENRRLYALMFRVQLSAWGWVLFQEFDTAAVASTLLFTSLAIVHGAVELARDDRYWAEARAIARKKQQSRVYR